MVSKTAREGQAPSSQTARKGTQELSKDTVREGIQTPLNKTARARTRVPVRKDSTKQTETAGEFTLAREAMGKKVELVETVGVEELRNALKE